MYNNQNIFAKILRKEIPAKTVFENENIFAFYDINPKAKTHVLVIPKAEYVDFSHFISNSQSIEKFFKDVHYVTTNVLKLQNYKILTNNGSGAGQEVFHFHVHILGY